MTPRARAPNGMMALTLEMYSGNRMNPDRRTVQAHRMRTLRR
jgi:hypothetical protein